MAFVWVQHYFPLPVIYEDLGMGDELQRQLTSENLQNRTRGESSHGTVHCATDHVTEDSSQPSGYTNFPQPTQPNMEFEPYQQQQFPLSHHGGAAMDMRSIAGALPDYSSLRQYPQQSFQPQFPSHANSNQSMMYQYQQGAQFAGQTGTNFNPNLNQQLPFQFMQTQPGRPQPQYANFPGVSQQSPAFGGQNVQLQHDFSQQQPHNYLQIPPGQYGNTYPGRMGIGYQQPQLRPGMNMPINTAVPMYQQLAPQREYLGQRCLPMLIATEVRRTSSNSSLPSSAIRGPPRKPKQSGHALWVGNLPPGTHIIDLKDHFSRDATNDIESVFLISKSNCAFVNYKTEQSCAAAMSRFHDSRFQGVRLVCRLRRGSASAASVTPPAPPVAPSPTDPPPTSSETKEETAVGDESAVADEAVPVEEEPPEKVKEKFFVVKSLTIEDLERSVQTGVWATQAHNEDALNKAYQVRS
jgi:hypothetical protein